MREIKLRYVFKNLKNEKIFIEESPIECIEGAGDEPFILRDQQEWGLLSRDLFTGLKDKNGKEIYEGDILISISKADIPDIKFLVGFGENEDNNSFGFNCTSQLKGDTYALEKSVEKMEVIGNIYENPELLEAGK